MATKRALGHASRRVADATLLSMRTLNGVESAAMDASANSAPITKADSTSFLRIRNLTKRFGAFTALKDVSLDVATGEFVCFLGPSGCGKATLLRAIAGLDPQDEGLVEIAGRDVSHLPPAARDFGIVFQSYALFPNLTVAANVGYGLVNRRAGQAAPAGVDRKSTRLNTTPLSQ